MRIFVAACLAVLALGACSRIGSTKPADVATRGCEASASKEWRPATGGVYHVDVSSSGPDCTHAVATIAIRDQSGSVEWADAGASEHIMLLAQAHDLTAMQHALTEWANFDNHTIASSSALPAWPANAQGPQNGEFPFYPQGDMNRDSYEALRARNVPVICYVQGMESSSCIALDNGEFVKVGLQTFPG